MMGFRVRAILSSLAIALSSEAHAAPSAPDIIGGEKAEGGRWPFVVALLQADIKNNYDAQFCGGTLIAEQFVLTAAHCVESVEKTSEIRVFVGSQNLRRGGRREEIADIFIHPQWDPITFDFDVAIVKLARAVKDIRPVSFVFPKDEKKVVEGQMGLVVGWGDMNIDDEMQEFPDFLHQVQVPLVSRPVCNAPQSYAGQITARMLCAGLPEGGKDSCQGDSGGPLFVVLNGQRKVVQLGIVSWGEGCALRNYYGVYSRLAVLGGWVHKTMARNR